MVDHNVNLRNSISNELDRLVETGTQLASALRSVEGPVETFREGYEEWYSEACHVVRDVMPLRFEDFQHYYYREKGDSIQKLLGEASIPMNSPLQDLMDMAPKQHDKLLSLYTSQLGILRATMTAINGRLFEIAEMVQADLFDNELDAATHLAENGYLRAAGAVAGVVLETHLKSVAIKYKITIAKKNPTINVYNVELKKNSVIDQAQSRHIEMLGDLRNKCDHAHREDPTTEEIKDLISGVDKVIKSIY